MGNEMVPKNKILIFNGYYLPAKNYGGPLTSLVTMVETCSDENTFYIVAANHDYRDPKPFPGISVGWHDVGEAKVLYTETEKLNWNYKELKKIVDEVKPDLIWLVGIVVPYKKWPLARICREEGIPYIISPRGEVNENAFHLSYLKKKILSLVTVAFGIYKGAAYHVTCDEEITGLMKYYKVKRESIFLCPNIAVSKSLKDRHVEKKQGEINLVFISRIHEIKNLLTAIKAVNLLKGNVTFDIYGPLEDQSYWAECEKEIARAPKNVKISYCGSLQTTEVFETFVKYHCFLSPSKSENFGHAIAESLAAQCPVIVLKGATPWDDIEGLAGYACSENSEQVLADLIARIQNMDQSAYDAFLNTTAAYFAERRKSDDAVMQHKSMIQKVIDRQ